MTVTSSSHDLNYDKPAKLVFKGKWSQNHHQKMTYTSFHLVLKVVSIIIAGFIDLLVKIYGIIDKVNDAQILNELF